MTVSSTMRPEAQWLERDRLLYLLRDEQRFGTALRLLLLGAAVATWALSDGVLSDGALLVPLVALLLVSLLVWRVLQPVGRLEPPIARQWIAIGFTVDILLVLVALLADASPQSDLYLLFVPLALKSIFLYGRWRGARFIPFSFIPLYALALLLHGETWRIWLEPFVLRRALFLLLVAFVALHVAGELYAAREQARQNNLRLGQRKADLDTRTLVLTQTATNLANRVLELRSLQEGMKAINASLDLSVLLELVVDNVSEVFGGASCAIGLREGDRLNIAALNAGTDDSLTGSDLTALETVAARVMRAGEAVLLSETPESEERFKAAMAVPMVVDGKSIGALMAMRMGYSPFTPDDQQRLSAFADQAALAVKNSRLYEQVEELYRDVKERSAELEAVLDSIGDAVIVTGRTGQVELTNPVATLILGLPDEPQLGQPLPQEVLRGGFEEHLRSTLSSKSGDPVLAELTVRGGNLQGHRTYQAHFAPLRDQDGHPRGVVTVFRDITAAKELEQLKSNFVSTISHELRTPLHSIKGFVNIILSERSTGSLTDVQRDFLTTVRDQTTRLERMILDLLEFNRLQSGQIKLNPEALDLALMAAAMTEQLRPVAEESSVTLLCLIEQSLPVEGDRLRIEQVFYNLIANAIKFTPAGGRVWVTGELGGQVAEIVVRDTGIGIPAAEQERIFERFYQVDASQTRKYGGAGLGLAICKHIIERHGGRIWAESDEGGGSAFHFTLPRELVGATPLTIDFSRLQAS